MNLDTIIALIIGFALIFIVIILYLLGYLKHVKSAAKILGVVGGAGAIAGALI